MLIHLEQLEGLLYRLITAVSGVGEGLAAERNLPVGGLGAIVLGDDRLSAEARVDIYANMYFYRLLDVLKEDFPATFAVLGRDNFHNLVTGYLVEYPPTEPSVYCLGRHLADFLRGHPIKENAPYVADLAALERATVEVFQAANADAGVLDTNQMRAIPADRWPRLKLITQPAVQILSLEWRVTELLRAVEDKREWKPAEQGAVKVLVWRRDSRVFHRELESVEHLALESARRGATFAEICELVAADANQPAPVEEINRLLARWLGDGIFQLEQ
jgi:hypothetical protein